MAILGAHLSIAGGYHKAVENALLFGCDCAQSPAELQSPAGAESGKGMAKVSW